MIKKLLVVCALLMGFATVLWAGEAVYFEGSTWDAYTGYSTITSATANTSSAHAIQYDTKYGVWIDCAATTLDVGLTYKLSFDTTSANFVYPNGTTWIVESLTSTDPVVYAFEPIAGMNYIKFLLMPTGSNSGASCKVVLFEQ